MTNRVMFEIYAGRRARQYAGQVGVLGVIAVLISFIGVDTMKMLPPLILFGTWFAMGVVYMVSRRLTSAPSLMEDASERARTLAEPSLKWPLVAVNLLLPISLHGVCALFMGVELAKFTEWMVWSVIFTGFAHIVLAGCCASYARRRVEEAQNGPHGLALICKVYLITLGAGVVPAGPYFFIPVAYMALTGLYIFPLLAWVDRRFRAEEAAFDHAKQCQLAVV